MSSDIIMLKLVVGFTKGGVIGLDEFKDTA